MAEKKAKPAKRQVKNPETFRQRAVNAAANDGKKPGQNILGRISQPFAATAARLGSYRFMRPLKKPARLLGKVLFPVYIRKSWQELRQVEWPGLRLSLRLTGAVLVFALILSLAIAGVDYVIDKLFRNILLK